MRLLVYFDDNDFLKWLKINISRIAVKNHFNLNCIFYNNASLFKKSIIYENDFILLGTSINSETNIDVIHFITNLKSEKNLFISVIINNNNDFLYYLNMATFHCLIKSEIKFSTLNRCIDLMRKIYVNSRQLSFLTKENEYVQINVLDVICIYIENRHVCIKTNRNKTIKLKERVFANIKNDLSEDIFLHICKAISINLNYIEKFTETKNTLDLIVKNGDIFSVPRINRKIVKNKILNHFNTK